MACNNSTTIFFGGPSFGAATQLFSDTNLTILAPDGWYSFGGTTRQVLSGVLSSPQSCAPCVLSCGLKAKRITGGAGKYKLNYDLGSGTGAVIIKYNTKATPSQLTWTFDGVSASEYSHPVQGYIEGVVGTYASSINGGTYTCSGTTISSDFGSNNQQFFGSEFIFNILTQSFEVNTDPSGSLINVSMGPFNPADVNLFGEANETLTMVIPKPISAGNSLSVIVDVLCENNVSYLDVFCPISLNMFDAGVIDGACGTVGNFIYTASVYTSTGVSSIIGVNDWAFEDINGVTPMPAGIYPVVIGGVNNFVTVDTNGVVSSVSTC